jgi:hypothetical protein
VDELLLQLIAASHDIFVKYQRRSADLDNARDKLFRMREDRKRLEGAICSTLTQVESEPITKPTKLRSPRKEELES